MMRFLFALIMSGLTLAYVQETKSTDSKQTTSTGSQTPLNIIYANTVIINITKSAHADGPKKKKSSGLKTKIGLSMFRAAADTYLEEKAKQED